MTKLDYAELRRDPRWQKKRLEVMERDEFKCVSCEDAGKTLNVHHAYYVTGRKPWEYPMFSLSTLCADCHDEKHNPIERDPEEISTPLEEWENELDLIFGENVKQAGCFWYVACRIAIAAKGGHERIQLFRKIETFLDSIT